MPPMPATAALWLRGGVRPPARTCQRDLEIAMEMELREFGAACERFRAQGQKGRRPMSARMLFVQEHEDHCRRMAIMRALMKEMDRRGAAVMTHKAPRRK